MRDLPCPYYDEKHFLTICTKLNLHSLGFGLKEEGNLENSNEDEKSDKILNAIVI